MATYRSIVGHKINKLSSDPAEPLTGQMWYNSTTGTLRGIGVVQAWSSSGNLTDARSEIGSAVSAPTESALGFGGSDPIGNPSNKTEEYNGSGWSTGGTLNTARRTTQGFGTQTAGVAAGGFNAPPGAYHSVEEYNGSSWTANSAPGELGTGRYNAGCSGTLTAGAIFGGSDVSPSTITATEEYDGTNWTAGGALSTGRSSLGGVGTQTASLAFGGREPSISAKTEEYDGSSWTSVNSMNTARYLLSGGGTQTSMIAFGGTTASPAPAGETGASEQYDGTTWTTSPASMATARYYAGGTGTSKGSAVVFGGNPGPGTTNLTEEFNSSTNTITAAAWAAGGNVNTARNYLAGMGTQTAGLIAGGYDGADVNNSEEYNGTSWTEGNNINTTRSNWSGGGTQTAGWGCGGYITPGVTADTELYDGTSWSETGNLNTAVYNGATFGIQTAGVVAGGGKATPSLGTRTNRTEHFNGSAWTNVPGTLSSVTRLNTGFGTQTAGVSVGGTTGSGVTTTVNEYNGSAWTNVTGIPVATFQGGAAGTQTDGLYFGGAQPTQTATTLGYDGTSWSTRPSMGTARGYGGPANAGSSTSTFYAAGKAPVTNATEEFTGETTAANIENFTTS